MQRHGDPGRRAGHRRAAAPGRHPHRRRARDGQRGRAGPAARQGHGTGSTAGPRRRRPAGGRRARGQVGQRRGHLRHRPDRPQADGGPADPPGRRRRRAAAQARAVRAHGHDQGAAARLHHAEPLDAPSPPPPTPPATIARLARGLLADLDTSGGVRLLGVGVSGLADWVQEDLFGETTEDEAEELPPRSRCRTTRGRTWAPGHGRRAHRDGPRLGVGLGPRAW